MTAFEEQQLILLRQQTMATQSHATLVKTVVFTIVIILGGIFLLAVLVNSLDAMNTAQYGNTRSR
jgi:hypothetical protein